MIDQTIRFFKFSFVGVISTLSSLAFNFIFLKIASVNFYISYILSYIISIFFSYLLNARYVFNSKRSSLNFFYFFLLYSSSMIAGTFLLWLLKKLVNCDILIYTFLILPFTVCINFFGSKILFNKKC